MTAPFRPPASAKAVGGVSDRMREAFGVDGYDDARGGSERRAARVYDEIEKGLSFGRFGGVPQKGRMAAVLLALLRRLEWDPDIRAFAGAMPHVPDPFDITQLRSMVGRLGYGSRVQRVKGRHLAKRKGADVVLTARSGPHMVALREDGRPVLRCPATHAELRIRRRKTYEVLVFTADPPKPEHQGKDGWSARQSRRFSPEIRLLTALILLSNLLVVATSLWIMAVFDVAIPAQAPDTLAMFVLGLGGLFAIDLWLRRIRGRVIARVSGRLEYILGTALFSKLMSFPLVMLTSSSVSDQISRLKQFETVRDFFSGSVVAVLLELPFLLILVAVIAFISPLLAAISIGFVALFAVTVFLMYPRIARSSAELSRHRSEHQRLILETLGRRRQITSMGLAGVWSRRVAASTARAVDARMTMERKNRLLATLTTAATPLSGGTVLLCGAALVIDGQITGGQLVATTILVWRLLAPVQQTLLVAMRLPEIRRLSQQIDAVMRIDPNLQTVRSGLVRHLEPRVDVDDLVVRYPRAATAALSGVSLRVAAGDMVVVDGPSGGGKTTLLRAIAGQYAAQAGSVRVGGTNIQQIAPSDLAEKIGYITNQSLVFHGTVAQNLFLAAPAASMVDLRAIAEELGILEQIEDLPTGFDTRLDHAEQARIPGGLRTMIAAAQVLLRRPRIILFDAPSTPLPIRHETCLLNAFRSRRGASTLFLVSPNPALARVADQHVVLRAGRIHNPRSLEAAK